MQYQVVHMSDSESWNGEECNPNSSSHHCYCCSSFLDCDPDSIYSTCYRGELDQSQGETGEDWGTSLIDFGASATLGPLIHSGAHFTDSISSSCTRISSHLIDTIYPPPLLYRDKVSISTIAILIFYYHFYIFHFSCTLYSLFQQGTFSLLLLYSHFNHSGLYFIVF